MLRNDTIPYLCEQVPKTGTIMDWTLVNTVNFPFQKSDWYDNSTMSFPCERSPNWQVFCAQIVRCFYHIVEKEFTKSNINQP